MAKTKKQKKSKKKSEDKFPIGILLMTGVFCLLSLVVLNYIDPPTSTDYITTEVTDSIELTESLTESNEENTTQENSIITTEIIPEVVAEQGAK